VAVKSSADDRRDGLSPKRVGNAEVPTLCGDPGVSTVVYFIRIR